LKNAPGFGDLFLIVPFLGMGFGVGLLFFSRFAVARPVVMGFAAQENFHERQREGKGWLQAEGQA
jgi:hypothetical protein